MSERKRKSLLLVVTAYKLRREKNDAKKTERVGRAIMYGEA